MIARRFNNLISIIIALSMAVAPLGASAQSERKDLRLILETKVPDIDSTRFVVDFNEMSFSELGELPKKLADNGDILPGSTEPLKVFVFVPDGLPAAEREQFVNGVKAQLKESYPSAQYDVQAVELEITQAEREKEIANQRITTAEEAFSEQGEDVSWITKALRAANDLLVREAVAWKHDFKGQLARYFWYRKTKSVNENDKAIGGVVGKYRGVASLAVWFNANGGLTVPTIAQSAMSFLLDWFFSKYEKDLDQWKGRHRIPLENVPVLKYAVRLYNELPAFKSWIINSFIIGLPTAAYFRYWSSVADPARTSSPFTSPEFITTYLTALGLGSIAAAYGSQAPRVFRKKGYANSRLEHFVYMSYGILFQLGGWFMGLGWDGVVLGMAFTEGAAKASLYAYARSRPWKEPRAIVLHPDLVKREVDEALYKVGIHPYELESPTKADFSERVKRLKKYMDLSWREKFALRAREIYKTCQDILSSKDSDSKNQKSGNG